MIISENNNTPATIEQDNSNMNDAGIMNTNNKNKNYDKQNYKGKTHKNSSNSSEQRNQEGDELKVGYILGLRSEWIEKKAFFEVFLEKITNYILQEFTNLRDIVRPIQELKDPSVNFKKYNMPKNLSAKQKESGAEVAIQAQRIKLYAA